MDEEDGLNITSRGTQVVAQLVKNRFLRRQLCAVASKYRMIRVSPHCSTQFCNDCTLLRRLHLQLHVPQDPVGPRTGPSSVSS
eukprot:6459749-Amphidinium_carterae.1